MQSKISCFNKTIFIKNLTRFWPFAVLYGVYLVFAHPLILYVELSVPSRDAWNVVTNHFASMAEPVSIFIFAIVMALAVFGYLFQSRSTNMLHTFPVTRGELFVTNAVSAWVLMLIPQFLAALAMNFVIIGKVNGLVWAVWAWFGISVGETVFFLGLASFSVMLSGQLLPAAFFYMIWNFLYIVVVGLTDAVAELFVFGLSGNLIEPHSHVLFPLARFFRYVGFDIHETEQMKSLQTAGTGTLLAYVFVGLVFLAAAYLAYRKRALECAGDFLSFRFTRPVFRWGVAIICGAAVALVMTMMLCDGRGTRSHAATLFIVWLVILSSVLFFVAEMFIEKSFRVFKRRIALECVSCIAVLLVGVALLNFDVFGVESYVPDVSQVALVELSGDGSASFESEADIEKVVALHRLILERVDEHKKEADFGFVNLYIGIHYRMNDGKQVDRSYPLCISDKEYLDKLWAQFGELMYDKEAVKRSFFGMNYGELDWKIASVMLEYDTGTDSVYTPVYGTEEELQRFYEAAFADIEAGAFTNSEALYQSGGPAAGLSDAGSDIPMNATLTLELMTEQPLENIRVARTTHIAESHSENSTAVSIQTYLFLNSECTHLIDVLIDMGVIDDAEDLSLELDQMKM